MKTKLLALSIAALGSMALASTAMANTQTLDVVGAPTAQSSTAFGPASLDVTTTTGPDTEGAQIKPATRAQIFFDNDFVFSTKGLPACKQNLAGISKTMAMEKCPTSIVGGGVAHVALGGFLQNALTGASNVVDAQITAFNGAPDAQGRPRLILHSWTETLGFGTVLTGVLKTTSQAGFGKVLDVSIPELPLSSAIIDFQTKVQKSWKRVVRVKGKVRRVTEHFVKAKCATGTWNFDSTFDYNGASSNDAQDSMSCTKK